MQRNHSVLLLIIMLLSSVLMSGCGSKTKVPDSVIELAIEDKLAYGSWSYSNPIATNYDSYKYQVEHKPNKDAHTDAVTVALQLFYPYGDRILIGKQIYQYTRSDDIWSEMDWLWDWDNLSSTVDPDSITRTWESTFGEKYTVTIDSIDFDAGTVTCSYSFSYDDRNYANSGTYNLDSRDQNMVKIEEDRVTLILEFSPEHGVQASFYQT